jgi:hypothetical protein
MELAARTKKKPSMLCAIFEYMDILHVLRAPSIKFIILVVRAESNDSLSSS